MHDGSYRVTLVELLRRTVLVVIVLVYTVALNVVLILHVLRILFGPVAGTLVAMCVHSFGLSKLIDFTADEAGEELFGKCMVYDLACKSR